jgi:hydroxylamine dehydrogenase
MRAGTEKVAQLALALSLMLVAGAVGASEQVGGRAAEGAGAPAIAAKKEPAGQTSCVGCHAKITPHIVSDWAESKHSKSGVDCAACHGDQHTSADDVAKVKLPTPETCEPCHAERVKQFKSGKHAYAWTAMQAMPTAHWQPMAMTEGLKGCGGCHKIGLKSEADYKELKDTSAGFGIASCDACHTRHTFSVREARQPQACQTCHMGYDYPQWEMYSTSKMGVRYLLAQTGVLPAAAAGPSCQTCHMPDGRHDVMTGWGYLGVRLPLPEDKQWAADRTTVLQAMGVLDPDGKPTKRFEAFKEQKVMRLTQEEWQAQRDGMLKICHNCHSANFAKAQLGAGDDMIRQADHVTAEAILIVADLYKDGILQKPRDYAYPFPDVLTFHDAPTAIELKLSEMIMQHRMHTFMGTFHSNPDYALWHGWSALQRDLVEIKAMAADLRERAAAKK